MSSRIPTGLLVSALVATAFGPAAASGPGPRLRLAILPCTNIETTFKKFHPLLTYLTSASGATVTLAVPSDLAEFEAEVANGRIDLALQDPHTYRELSGLFDDASLLQARGLDATTRQSAVVVVRRDSGLSDLAQLRGRTVMFGPRTSSPKWVAARLLFERIGIPVERELKWVNGGCCEDIAFAVSVRAVDAGVICDHFLGLHGARQKDLGVDPETLRVIGRTPECPTRIFAARRGVPTAVVAAISRALLDLDRGDPAHAAILAGAEISGFLRTTRATYLEDLGSSGAAEGPR